MDHQVLARKWRPRIFKEMVGQEHVLKALINALDHNRLHHAYLFTGTRGVGKTTIARILAKCLNCEKGVTSEPCGTCSSCVEINEGRCIDLIEVDAASRTKVEDTRELLDNVQYLPTRARYKVYLIDEVHMLSSNSFNALLKTLEEPPPHVKFLLATTDPQKLPVTVLSRCLQFNLKNMSPERVAEHLRFVLGEEKIQFDEAALWQLGRAANGSMRDGLSLTDQAISFGENSVMESDVSIMLGSIDRSRVQQILQALLDKNAALILDQIAELADFSPDYTTVLEELISLLHRIAVTQAVPDAEGNDVALTEKLRGYANQISAEELQLYYQIALIGRRDLPLNPDPKAGLEMVLLRMLAFSPVDSAQPQGPKKKLTTKPAGSSAPVSTPVDGSSDRLQRPSITVTASSQPDSLGQSKAAQALTGTKDKTRRAAQIDDRIEIVQNQRAGAVKERLAPTAILANDEDEKRLESADDTSGLSSVPNEYAEYAQCNPQQGSSDLEVVRKTTISNEEKVSGSAPSVEIETTVSRDSNRTTGKHAVKERFPIGDLNNNDDWIKLSYQSPMRGMTRNIALQCTFESRNETHIHLLIDPQYIDLLNDSHQSRIEQGLSEALTNAVKVAIKAGSSTHETPAAWQQRLQGERLQAAREALRNDNNVKRWVTDFGATLEEDSIKPVD